MPITITSPNNTFTSFPIVRAISNVAVGQLVVTADGGLSARPVNPSFTLANENANVVSVLASNSIQITNSTVASYAGNYSNDKKLFRLTNSDTFVRISRGTINSTSFLFTIFASNGAITAGPTTILANVGSSYFCVGAPLTTDKFVTLFSNSIGGLNYAIYNANGSVAVSPTIFPAQTVTSVYNLASQNSTFRSADYGHSYASRITPMPNGQWAATFLGANSSSNGLFCLIANDSGGVVTSDFPLFDGSPSGYGLSSYVGNTTTVYTTPTITSLVTANNNLVFGIGSPRLASPYSTIPRFVYRYTTAGTKVGGMSLDVEYSGTSVQYNSALAELSNGCIVVSYCVQGQQTWGAPGILVLTPNTASMIRRGALMNRYSYPNNYIANNTTGDWYSSSPTFAVVNNTIVVVMSSGYVPNAAFTAADGSATQNTGSYNLYAFIYDDTVTTNNAVQGGTGDGLWPPRTIKLIAGNATPFTTSYPEFVNISGNTIYGFSQNTVFSISMDGLTKSSATLLQSSLSPDCPWSTTIDGSLSFSINYTGSYNGNIVKTLPTNILGVAMMSINSGSYGRIANSGFYALSTNVNSGTVRINNTQVLTVAGNNQAMILSSNLVIVANTSNTVTLRNIN